MPWRAAGADDAVNLYHDSASGLRDDRRDLDRLPASPGGPFTGGSSARWRAALVVELGEKGEVRAIEKPRSGKPVDLLVVHYFEIIVAKSGALTLRQQCTLTSGGVDDDNRS